MNQPLAPGTLLLVRFATHAQKRLGDPGATYLSRQHTTLHVGETLEVVEDFGRGYLWVRRGEKGHVYQVHMTDLVAKPTDAQVAHGTVEAKRTEIERDEARAALLQAEAERVSLKALYDGLAAGYDQANRERVAALDERDQAQGWVRNLRQQRDALQAQLAEAQANLRAYKIGLDALSEAYLKAKEVIK